MAEISFNILLDESGDKTNLTVDNPMNYAVGALIFFENYNSLEQKFLERVNNITPLRIILEKSHNLKFETLKKEPNYNELYDLILGFLSLEKCKFYWHPIKDQNIKHIKQEDGGIRFTKLVESCHLDIIANLIIILKKNGHKVGQIGLFCDQGTYNPKNGENHFCIYIKDRAFCYFKIPE